MPVRYGIIGCGAIAQRRHIPECVANPASQLVAIADVVKDRVEEIAAKNKVRLPASNAPSSTTAERFAPSIWLGDWWITERVPR